MHTVILANKYGGERILITDSAFEVRQGSSGLRYVDFSGPTRFWDYTGQDRMFESPVVTITDDESVRVVTTS